jgi:TRAP-type C4-dicarboxylate transport system permease small subunit
MQWIIEKTSRGLGFVERGFGLMAGLVVMALMVVVCAEVLGRSAFNQPIRGSIDIVSQMMAVAVSGGIAFCQSRFGNVRMTILTNRLTGRPKWLSEAFSLLVAAWVVYVLARGSWAFLQRALRSGADTPELHIPTSIGISFVTIALCLLLARLLVQLIESLRLFVQPRSVSTIFSIPGARSGALTAKED